MHLLYDFTAIVWSVFDNHTFLLCVWNYTSSYECLQIAIEDAIP